MEKETGNIVETESGVNEEVTQKETSEKKYSESEKDSEVSRAVESFKKNFLKKHEKQELEKNGELKEILEMERKEKHQLLMSIKARDLVAENNLPKDLVEDLVALNDEDKMENFVKKIGQVIKNSTDQEIKKRVSTPYPAQGMAPVSKSITDDYETYLEWRKTKK
jgi:hypothetical protein